MDLIRVEQAGSQEFRISVRTHQISADNVIDEGGDDRGPRPTELLVGSLGACIGMAIARYCQTIDQDTDSISIYLTYDLKDRPRRIANIVADIELPADFPESRKSALKGIITSCPIHNTLLLPPEIDIEIGV